MVRTAWQIAVVGAGPVGLALALHAARLLPHARLTLFDARPRDRDVAADPRTLALSLGSVQFLQQLGCWPAAAAAAITEVHVSQQPPSWGQAELQIHAAELGQPQLGATLGYGALVAPLQQAWLALAAAQPARLHTRFGTPVTALKALPDGVEVDAGVAERFDLAVVAEGGILGTRDARDVEDARHQRRRRALTADYKQTAWVGSVTLAGATPGRAVERFTRRGPVALLPLPPRSSSKQAMPTLQRATAVRRWCGACPAATTRFPRCRTHSASRC